MHKAWGMPHRGTMGRRRRQKGVCHGMQLLMRRDKLERRDDATQEWLVPTNALERLAAWLGIAPAQVEGETEGERRHRLVHAITREEKRLSKCPRVERWQHASACVAASASEPTS